MRLASLPWAAVALAAAALVAAPQAAEFPMPEANPQRKDEPKKKQPEEAPPEKSLPKDKPTKAWSDSEVAAAKAKCTELLAGIELDYEPLPPIKEGLCGAPAPIRLKSIGDPPVVIYPPATMRCELAAALNDWLKDRVQPAAKATFAAAVTRIRNAASYNCRNRYGGTNTRLSEHALANAIDVSEFGLASGKRITVLASWRHVATAIVLPPPVPLPNPARLDTAASAARAAARAKASETTSAIGRVSKMRSVGSTIVEVTKVRANPFVRPTSQPSARFPRSELPEQFSTARSPSRIAAAASARAKSNPFVAEPKTNPFVSPLPEPQESTKVNDELEPEHPEVVEPEARPAREEEPGKVGTAPKPRPPESIPEADAAFVRTVHGEACKIFGTVLGPAANEAHKDHFHLDLKARRTSGFCE